MNLAKQFIKKIKWFVDEKTGCWNVTNGTDNGDGYMYISVYDKTVVLGKTKTRSKRVAAHRVSYMAFNGEIPKGKCIIHSCDNRSCVNPDHLSIGTKKQNTQDMIKKDRCNRWEDRNGKRQKLTEQQVADIKSSELSSYKLADIYPVSSVQIRRIRNGSRCSNV